MDLKINDSRESKADATATGNFQYFQAIFGPAWLRLKADLITRSTLVLEPESLPLESVASDDPAIATLPAGVVCGAPFGLLALSFSSGSLATEFLKNNPALGAALITQVRQHQIFWLRPFNRLPPRTKVDGVTLITSGVVGMFHPDAALQVSVVQRGPPLEIDLASLNFSGCLKDFIDEWLIREQHGPPLIKVNSRRMKLNAHFWAAWLVRVAGLGFDKQRGVFLVRLHGQNETIIPGTKVPLLVARLLHQARQSGCSIPLQEINTRNVKEIVGAIKTLFTTDCPAESEVMAEFVEVGFESRPGSLVTKNEAVLACMRYRKSRGLDNYSEARLRQNLKRAIMQRFNVCESHHKGRVFCGLALRAAWRSQTSLPTASDSAKDAAAEKANINASEAGPDTHGRNGRADTQNPRKFP